MRKSRTFDNDDVCDRIVGRRYYNFSCCQEGKGQTEHVFNFQKYDYNRRMYPNTSKECSNTCKNICYTSNESCKEIFCKSKEICSCCGFCCNSRDICSTCKENRYCCKKAVSPCPNCCNIPESISPNCEECSFLSWN